MSDELLIAIPAAGASRRLGRPKQLVPIGKESLLRRQCRVAIESGVGPVAVILGCHADMCSKVLDDLPVMVFRNEDWSEGLSASIRTATQAAMKADAAGLLLLHCDQFRISPEDLRALAAAWKESDKSRICRARHETYAGPPVIFPSRCFPELLSLQGDEGARRLISTSGANLPMDVAMPNALFDLDRPEQLLDLEAAT